MAYIGRPLQVANLAVQSGTGDGSDTTPIATLDYATTTNGIAVYLDGVRQLAGTDFNVTAQTTLTFTTAPANGVGIDVYFLGLELSLPTPADATVAKAKITTTLINEHVDTTITAADSILFSDATDSNANKKDTVQGVLDLVTASGWEYVSVGTASNSASIAFTNMAAGYDYQYVIDNLFHVTNNTGFNYQLGVAGPTYRTSGYLSTIAMMNNAGTSQGTVVTGHIQIISDGIEQMGDQTNEGAYRIVLELTDPAGTSNKTGGFSRASFYGASPQLVTELGDGVYTSAAEAHVAIKFQSTSGNMTTGTFLQYRRKRS